MGDCNGDTAIHSAAERGRLEVGLKNLDFAAPTVGTQQMAEAIAKHIQFTGVNHGKPNNHPQNHQFYGFMGVFFVFF